MTHGKLLYMNRIIFLLLLLPFVAIAQIQQPALSESDQRPLTNKDVTVSGEKPPITDYLIISQRGDTTHVDTTLNMSKDYKFNYLRRDDFELMPFANVGQPYNSLAKNFDMELLSPRLGARARHFNYFEVDDIYDYRVPTPFTELYFKTAINQGQQSDALFTSNLSPQFNFSIGYKGTRSVGDYENTLTSTGNFKFTANYNSKNGKYRMRLHTVFQDSENQESGGLDAASLAGFLSDDVTLRDRARLDVNLDDATSMLDGKRFYVDHDYEILGSRDSTSYHSARIYNKAFYEDKFYRYTEAAASELFLGESYISTNIEDKSDLEEGSIEAGLIYEHHILGFFKAGLARREYNYGYNSIVNLSSEFITNRLQGELYQFKAQFAKRIGDFDISGNGGLNVIGDFAGQYINGQAAYDFNDIKVQAGINISSRAPDFNFLLFQSDYVNYNWQNDFDNIKTQELFFNATSTKFADLELRLTTIQDQTYFAQNEVTNPAGKITGFNARPFQASGTIAYLKIKARKDIPFLTYFGLDNTIMYQNVGQDESVLNVPTFTTRNSLYYKNRFFKRALQLQTGITFKYFSAYNMDGYDPVLGEFYTQSGEQFGAFPLVDFFVNARIRQTRIFFKVEHANAPFSDPVFFSAPRNPYRDLSIRFGLVWDFFL